MKSLVIVESPTKAKTISKFLGKDYDIKYSMGHIMDLPKSKLGIDIKKNFTPQYEIVEDKKNILSDLKSAAKSSDSIILATDPDREGEAIAAHIKELLIAEGKQKDDKFKRIVFHEITEDAIKDALTTPRNVDVNLVDSQTARRVLDRLVGYQVSPILWKKVRRGLSAGRVQSVALRFIVEREREIQKFAKNDFYTITAILLKDKKNPAEFELLEINGERLERKETFALYDGDYTITKTSLEDQKEADKLVADLKTKTLTVADVVQKQTRRSPYPPFTTSTLQQEASRRFGFSGKRTMSLAQKLYEEGYITYHRTDSVTLSFAAITGIRKYLESNYGEKYLPESPRAYVTKQKLAQEAHEGIRPTKIAVTDAEVAADLGRDYAKLYEVIWKRALASQMADALIESTTVMVDAAGGSSADTYRLKTNGSVLLFDGFLKLNPQALQDVVLPQYAAGEKLDLKECQANRRETMPPPRYNDASLIATLEEKGIGRPSTYAAIISTLVDRTYVERIEKRFQPTPVGMTVNDFLVENFSTIDDIPFTADMEDQLDDVAHGKKNWVAMMNDFYRPFGKSIEEADESKRMKIEAEQTNEKCPQCGSNLIIRYGRFGKFMACGRFPECKFTKPFTEETNLTCPKDGGKVIVRKTRKGRKFYGCNNYPKCDFAAWKLEDIRKAS